MNHARLSLLVVLVILGLSLPTGAQTDGRKTLHGHVLDVVKQLQASGRLPGAQQLNLAIGLPLRNTNELAALLQQTSDPGSPNFRHYLTPDEFTQRFGPTEDQYQAVVAFAEKNGLRVTHTHPNRLLLDVAAPVANIEKTFRIALRTYRHPTEDRDFYAPDTEPSVEKNLAVLDVSGLNNYVRPHPHIHPVPAASVSDNAVFKSGSASGGAYMGNDFRAAYLPGVTLTGAGQAVGLFEFDGFYANDIAAYESSNSLPNVPLQTVLLDGFSGKPTAGKFSGNGEVALDIEMVVAMSPGISKVILYEGGPNGLQNDILNQMATDNEAGQLSCSWGWGGGPSATTDNIFQQMIAQGQSFFNASGDTDAFPPGTVDDPNTFNAPSSSPYITQVGGTTLTTTGPGGAWVSEKVWNWGGGTGSGGGVSSFYSIPTWQQGTGMTANHGSTTKRNIPDVAMIADNIFTIESNGKKSVVGGTSCAAPLWAAFIALVNERAAAAGNPPVGFINPAVYAIGTGADYAAAFHDTTAGNNTWKKSAQNFSAVNGFDLCTGWGTPAGINLINALAPGPDVVINNYVVVGGSGNPTNGAIEPGDDVTVNFALQNTGNVSTTNLVVTLLETNGVVSPDGPQIYGALAADGSIVTQPFTFTASGDCGGSITAVFQLQDGANDLGLISQVIPLGTRVPIFSENFDGVASPALPGGWTTTNSGAQARWVTKTNSHDTAPNAAFTAGAKSAGVNELVSPPVAITLGDAQLTFRHNYNLQSGHDGGVLEIKIGTNAFTDIIKAGGSFVKGGYVKTLGSGKQNPLGVRSSWTGSSGGFVTTTINLPASAAGQTVQFKWRCGTDKTTASAGWYVDSIIVSGLDCDSAPAISSALSNSVRVSWKTSPAITSTIPINLVAQGMTGDGKFQFSFNTASNANYTVEYSTNLAQWFPLKTVGGTGKPVTVTDPNAPGSRQCFYRIIPSPQ